jgi:hypothetical protein
MGKKGDLDHPSLLVIDASESTSFTHAKHIRRSHLSGFVEILYVQQAELYFIKYTGNSDVFLNGVPVKPGSIGVLAVGSALRWDKDEPIYYGDILSKFKIR